MVSTETRTLAQQVQAAAHPLTGAPNEYDPLLDLIDDARVVLLGEASHGTHEFYAARAAITQRLITERGFTVVAVEADWPDAYRVNRWVHGAGSDATAADALANFKGFPRWMWRNTVVQDFVQWLRTHNAALPTNTPQTGFYGLDLYSLHGSIMAVVEYLERVDPHAAAQARERYGCFDQLDRVPQEYGYAASHDRDRSCENEVAAQLVELQGRAAEYATRDGGAAEDEYFDAEQNARLAKNAEAYYRTMFAGHVASWNLRDTHMVDTLDALLAHLDRHGGRSKAVVWAHNSHLGDARATERSSRQQINVGQLVRERYADDAVLIGFTTYDGTVTAASDWGAPAERKRVRPGLAGSYEALFHEVGLPQFLLPLRNNDAVLGLRRAHLERAIGVIYRPDTERHSHYFHAHLPDQFDAVIHFDHTRAVEPLEPTAGWTASEDAETFPTGL